MASVLLRTQGKAVLSMNLVVWMRSSWENCKQQYQRPNNRLVPIRHCTSDLKHPEIFKEIRDCKNCPSQVPRTQGSFFKCLLSSGQLSKTQRYSVYNGIKQRKEANFHIWEAESRECLGILLVKWWRNDESVASFWPTEPFQIWMVYTVILLNPRPSCFSLRTVLATYSDMEITNSNVFKSAAWLCVDFS